MSAPAPAPAWTPIFPTLRRLQVKEQRETRQKELHRLRYARTVKDRLAALFPAENEVEWQSGGIGVYLRAPHSIGVLQLYNWEDVDSYVYRLAQPDESPDQSDFSSDEELQESNGDDEDQDFGCARQRDR
jgi:hypothetical protein